MKKIPLTQGKFALVDDDDYDFLMQWKWCYLRNKKYDGYAIRRNIFTGKHMMMHRVINKTPDEYETDHIDENKLNNQKNNLRNCSKAQNNGNRKRYNKNRRGIYKGVFSAKDKIKWRAAICINRKQLHLGTFLCEKEAAVAYNNAAIKHFGEYARINEIN